MSQCIDEILSGIKSKDSCSTETENPRIISITEANGKVVVMFSNGSFMDADMSLVDDSLSEALTKEQSDSVKDITVFKEKLYANLEPVMDLGGKISHYVLKTTFLEGN